MCGIAGLILTKNEFKSHLEIKRVILAFASRMISRGPDSQGSWEDSEIGIGLGHARLSILDLSSAGHQPMVSSSGRYVVVLNGEIYNFQEIRQRLEFESGVKLKWKGHSDTEVFLNAVEQYGVIPSLKMALGMFAIGVWDREENELILARDRLGEKPLYYGQCPEGFVFASDLFCFKEFGRNFWKIDRNSLALYFRHNYIPAPYSIFENVWKLQPGHFLKLKLSDVHNNIVGNLKSEPYWDIYDIALSKLNNQEKNPIEFYEDRLKELLEKAIRKQMIADVPLGAFLSGGVDSSLIAGIMQSISSKPIKTFTIGFDNPNYDEAVYAKEVAAFIGTEHTEMYVSPKTALGVIPQIGKIYSEPFADSSQIPTYLVCQLAKRNVTVSLSGDAGDELFGGYRRYFLMEKIWKFARFGNKKTRRKIAKQLEKVGGLADYLSGFSGINLSKFSNRIARVAELYRQESFDDLYKSIVSHFQSPLDFVLGSSFEPTTNLDFEGIRKTFPTNFEKMMFCDLVSYLPDDILVKVDRAAMGVSLETRIPFLDPEIVEFSFGIPIQYKVGNGRGKVILRNLLDKFVPRNLIERPKRGFAVPLGTWLKGPLKDWAEDLINPSRLARDGYLNVGKVWRLWQNHLLDKRACEFLLWDVLMFQCWLNEWQSL
jgi:asparagine synthase (glutamine-hydrolysing)